MGAGMAGTQPWTSPGMCAFLGSGFEITPLSSTKGPNLFCFLGSEQFFLLNASSVLPVRNHLAEGQPPALVERQAGEGVSDYPKQDTGSHREGACTLSWECELGTHPSIASDMAKHLRRDSPELGSEAPLPLAESHRTFNRPQFLL